ncbi:MAG: helix-turn-helix transcriptional regulator [Lachnospiraceae bacterium]|nr:helix-turn-helix transcriptional regulator [Lachnospiraceae bacterium]
MFEIDKQRFGEFIAECRKQKGITQKELAEKLFISDKAVSKWERGLSMPDITLLAPLAELLGVSVAELLECRRLQENEAIDTKQADELVKKVIVLSEEEQQALNVRKRKRIMIYLASVGISVVEIMLLLLLGYTPTDLFFYLGTAMILAVSFGIYFWIVMKEKLPTYYDENKVSIYGDGFFSMNMAGIHFNNNNWPHIIRVGRIWSVATMDILPILYLCLSLVFSKIWNMEWMAVLITPVVAGLFIPMYIVGKKFE